MKRVPYVNGTRVRRLGVVVQFDGHIFSHCHSEPALSARNLLFAVKRQIPRAMSLRSE